MPNFPTQVEVENEAAKIYDNIKNYIQFLNENSKVLLKKSKKTRTEFLIIKNSEDCTWRYCAPEVIDFYVKIVAFYMALDAFNVSPEKW